MAKTVFGMPGAGKQDAGGGDAVAPDGSPGAQQGGGGLPQKSGKEKPKLPLKPNPKPVVAPKPQSKSSAPPPLAKPSSPPAAAPGRQGMPGGGKTMFGMPAMKLPGQPQSAPEPSGASPTPVAPKPAPKKNSTPPLPNPAAALEQDDAFKATVLGVAAPSIQEGSEPLAEAPLPEAPLDIANSPAEPVLPIPGPDTAQATHGSPPDFAEEQGSVRIGVGINGNSRGKGSVPKWAIAIIIIGIAAALFFVGYTIIGNPFDPASAPEPAPEGAPSPEFP